MQIDLVNAVTFAVLGMMSQRLIGAVLTVLSILLYGVKRQVWADAH